ncbi:tetratricopeptide repeat protein [Acetobacteroides hydrogenigenes]|uniref:Uncharacterized protein n=1 Tax=Acetobacteroides hydrogenigenes TaxID=979970 RepID=A0A4R2ETK9_9BACT|nr:hypothetical protein [Acetobacteroides hydrogenigenes]TCN70104.1 hypothetical protein CLV25_10455 [Acetobacteroides hydrogenigenes]
MRNLALVTVAFLFIATSTYAQTGNTRYGTTPEQQNECLRNLSIYIDSFKEGIYKESYKFWKAAHKVCPLNARESLYQNGVKIYTYFYGNATSEKDKRAYLDTIMNLYDLRIKHFPNSENALQDKVNAFLKFFPDEQEKSLALVDSLFTKKGNSIDGAYVIIKMHLLNNLHKNGKVAENLILDFYANANQLFEQRASSNNESDKKHRENLDAMFVQSGIANCNNLTSIYEPRLGQNTNDIDLIKKVISLFKAFSCNTSPLYERAMKELLILEPTSSNMLAIANFYSQNGRLNEAVPHFLKAVDAEKNDSTKSRILLEIASLSFKNGEKVQARDYAKKAITVDESNGYAYQLLAIIYANERFGSDEVLKRAPLMLAVDYLKKAKAKSPEISETADKLIESYSANFPTKQDLFTYAYESGQVITVGGWINEKTSIKSR